MPGQPAQPAQPIQPAQHVQLASGAGALDLTGDDGPMTVPLTDDDIKAHLSKNSSFTKLWRLATGIPETKATVRQLLKTSAGSIESLLRSAPAGRKDQWIRLKSHLLKHADTLTGGGKVSRGVIDSIDTVIKVIMGDPPSEPVPVSARDRASVEDDLSENECDDEDPNQTHEGAESDSNEDDDAGENDTDVAVRGLPSLERPQDEPPPSAPEPVLQAFKLIMGVDELRASLRFDLSSYLLRVHRHLASGLARLDEQGEQACFEEPWKRMLGGGKCQSRKTPLKVVTLVLCRIMGVATVLVTTGVPGRVDIFAKLLALLRGLHIPHPVVTASSERRFTYEAALPGSLPRLVEQDRATRTPDSFVLNLPDVQTKSNEWACDVLRSGGCLVLNHSPAALDKARKLLFQARDPRQCSGDRALQFALVLDEADDYYRTAGAFRQGQESLRIKMEHALSRLRKLGPVLHLEVTATLLSIYAICRETGKASSIHAEDVVYTDASREYVDTCAFQPPRDPATGEPMFLNKHDLKVSNDYVNPMVRAVWHEAGKHQRALCLDATSPSVTARGNIYVKALHLLQQVPHAIAVVVAGSEIRWGTHKPRGDRPRDLWPGHPYRGKEKIVGAILEEIDRLYRRRPIFVFGYSQLARGISYRSRQRVPSHFILVLKQNMSMCRLVQAAGRANGEQATVLRKNGFQHVTLLTLHHDFDTVRLYPEFLQKIKSKMSEHNLTLDEAMRRPNSGYLPTANRPLGAKKVGLNPADHIVPAVPGPGQALGAEAEDAELRGRSHKRAILEVLQDSSAYDEDTAVSAKDVREELVTRSYDAKYARDPSNPPSALGVADVRLLLQDLTQDHQHRDAIVIEEPGRPKLYFLNQDVLQHFLPADTVPPPEGDAGGAQVDPGVGAAPTITPAIAMREEEVEEEVEDLDSDDDPAPLAADRRGPRQAELERARLKGREEDELRWQITQTVSPTNNGAGPSGAGASAMIIDCDLTSDDDSHAYKAVHLRLDAGEDQHNGSLQKAGGTPSTPVRIGTKRRSRPGSDPETPATIPQARNRKAPMRRINEY